MHMTKSMTKTKMTIKKITMMFPTKGILLMIQRMVKIIWQITKKGNDKSKIVRNEITRSSKDE